MSDRNIEQRNGVKKFAKLGKNGVETYELLRKIYGEETMSRSRVYEWHKRFKKGREDVHDNRKTGRPRTTTTEENIDKISEFVSKNRMKSIRFIAEELNIDRETVRTILNERLGMRNVSMVPIVTTVDKKCNYNQDSNRNVKS